MNYKNEAIYFVSSAFDLLDIYKTNPTSDFVGNKSAIALVYPYFLGISKNGFLGLYKEVEKNNSKIYILIAKQIKQTIEPYSSIGRLLSIYLSKIESV